MQKIDSLNDIPSFDNNDAENEFWDAHELSAELLDLAKRAGAKDPHRTKVSRVFEQIGNTPGDNAVSYMHKLAAEDGIDLNAAVIAMMEEE